MIREIQALHGTIESQFAAHGSDMEAHRHLQCYVIVQVSDCILIHDLNIYNDLSLASKIIKKQTMFIDLFVRLGSR